MIKTTITGFSWEKYHELKSSVKNRPMKQTTETVNQSISKRLKYYKYKDQFGYFQDQMNKAASVNDSWFKYQEKDFI